MSHEGLQSVKSIKKEQGWIEKADRKKTICPAEKLSESNFTNANINVISETEQIFKLIPFKGSIWLMTDFKISHRN